MKCFSRTSVTAQFFCIAFLFHRQPAYAVDFGGGLYATEAFGKYKLEGVPSVGIKPHTTKLGLNLALDSKLGTAQRFAYRLGATLGWWSLNDGRDYGFRGNGYGIGVDQTLGYIVSQHRAFQVYAGPSINLSIGRMQDALDTVILAAGGAGPSVGINFANGWHNTSYSLALTYILAFSILDWNSGVFPYRGTNHAVSMNATVFFASKPKGAP